MHLKQSCILTFLLQGKIKGIEFQLNEALHSSEVKSTYSSESGPRATVDGTDSSTVTKKLEEELKKRDALIEVCYPLQF